MSSVADNEGVSESDIIMFINDRTVQPYDSPQSLGITVADIVGRFQCSYDSSVYSAPNVGLGAL